jgi:hypothetical protein
MDVTGLRRPRVKVVGEDGNCFAILGRCQRAARRAGWPKAAIDAFVAEATAGTYDDLLATVMKFFDEPDEGGEDAEEG